MVDCCEAKIVGAPYDGPATAVVRKLRGNGAPGEGPALKNQAQSTQHLGAGTIDGTEAARLTSRVEVSRLTAPLRVA